MTDKLQLQRLQEKINLASQTAESVEDLLRKIALLQEEASQPQGKPPRLSNVVPDPPGQFKTEDSSSMSKDDTEGARYLVVSNGCAICFLDLKKGESVPTHSAFGVPLGALPKIATLNLIENGLPVAVGLFRLGSEIYMIGGQDFPAEANPRHDFLQVDSLYFDLFGFFLEKGWLSVGGIKGTSCAIRRLSVVEDAVCLSECKIGELNSPKFWPKVERIGEQLHVFECAPRSPFVPAHDWVFSHEVLNLEADSYCWRKIKETQAVDDFINSYLVVGNRIYAIASGKCLVFCSETEKWEAESREIDTRQMAAFKARQVWDILNGGEAICVGKFELEQNTGDHLYVLIAIVEYKEEREDYEGYYNYNGGVGVGTTSGVPDGVHAVAYLVTSTGLVVCKQIVPHFFKGPLEPHCVWASKVMKIEEKGETFCAIVNACAHVLESNVYDDGLGLLFINTFTVEMLPNKRGGVQKLLGEIFSGKPVKSTYEFVRLDVKNTYVYDPVGGEDRDGHGEPRRLITNVPLIEDVPRDRAEYEEWYAGKIRDVVKRAGDLSMFNGIDACFGWIPS